MASLWRREWNIRGKNESKEMSQRQAIAVVLVRTDGGSDQVVADSIVTHISGEKWMSS